MISPQSPSARRPAVWPDTFLSSRLPLTNWLYLRDPALSQWRHGCLPTPLSVYGFRVYSIATIYNGTVSGCLIDIRQILHMLLPEQIFLSILFKDQRGRLLINLWAAFILSCRGRGTAAYQPAGYKSGPLKPARRLTCGHHTWDTRRATTPRAV